MALRLNPNFKFELFVPFVNIFEVISPSLSLLLSAWLSFITFFAFAPLRRVRPIIPQKRISLFLVGGRGGEAIK